MQTLVQNLARLQQEIAAVCPITGLIAGTSPNLTALQVAVNCFITGVAFGATVDSNSVTITFDPAATILQQAAAIAIAVRFDPSDAAAATFNAKSGDIANLQSAATAAIAAINTFLAIPSPTAAQAITEVQAIDQRQKQIIQFLERFASNVLAAM